MANWEMFAGDLYPPLPAILTDSNGPISLASGSVTSVTMIAKGTSHTITGTCTILQVSFTGNTALNSNQITSASSTTGLWVPGTEPWPTGSTLYCAAALPAPTGSVGSWTLPTITAISGSTITMSQNATATATGVTIIGNIGTVQYQWVSGDTANADTYSGVHQILWTSGSKLQTVPNKASAEWTLTIDTLP